jgi:hypothetical protein
VGEGGEGRGLTRPSHAGELNGEFGVGSVIAQGAACDLDKLGDIEPITRMNASNWP